MKSLRFIPLTFLAGAHGFAIFAPYVLALLIVGHFLREHRRAVAARARAVSVPFAALASA